MAYGGLFIGPLLIGIGIGFLVDNVPAGALIGLGVGFIVGSLAELPFRIARKVERLQR